MDLAGVCVELGESCLVYESMNSTSSSIAHASLVNSVSDQGSFDGFHLPDFFVLVGEENGVAAARSVSLLGK